MEFVIALIVSFLITFIYTPFHIRNFRSRGIVGEDRHKITRPIVPEMGGVGIFLGIFVAYFIMYVFSSQSNYLLAIASLTIVFLIGIIDDSYAIRQRTKLLMLTISGLPLLLYKEGMIDLMVFDIRYGVMYAILVAVGMAAASNLTNILEGFNGEAIGLGVISTGFMTINGIILNEGMIVHLMAPACFALLAFLIYNRYPAKVFPGDTGTLLIGGLIGISTILGGYKILGIIVLLPQIIEFLLKTKVRFSGVKYGATKVDENGYLTPPPYLSVANVLTKRFHLTEPRLVLILWTLGIICGAISVLTAILLY